MSEAAADFVQLMSSSEAMSPICSEEHLQEQLAALESQLAHLHELRAAVQASKEGEMKKTVARVIVAAYDLPQMDQLNEPLDPTSGDKSSGSGSHGAGDVPHSREEYIFLMNYLRQSEKYDYVWVGGLDVRKLEVLDIRTTQQQLMENFNCIPVFGYDQAFDDFYNGFCKSVLWPLLHGIPPVSIYSIADRAISVDRAWNAYLRVNEAFAQQIMQFYNPSTDVIWVHDYHLFLLPFIIRQQLPDATICFYLHTCFPSSEIFRILPYRKQILQGILSSDVIWVQTGADKYHLINSFVKILGLSSNDESQIVTESGHTTSIKICPVGIDLDLIEDMKKDLGCSQGELYKKSCDSQIVVISVDEMDYVKGITHKLSTFELFLEKWPQFHQKVVLVQIVFPVRSESDEYHALQSQVNEQIGRINSKFGTVDFLPIHYINRHVEKSELLALFSIAKVAMITPLKDGMNLVPFQYIACQDPEEPGSLILSEFAGCSSVLRDAFVINPWATHEFAYALFSAIVEPMKERKERFDKLLNYVQSHTAKDWADEVMDCLISIRKTDH